MKNIVIIGAQWGDEGKGKIVDLLAPHFDIVARYQAGHTVYIGERKFILRLIPSGILHPSCTCVIGNGVVVHPRALVEELDELHQAGIESEGRLFVSDRAHLILPYHVALDKASERRLGASNIGTTLRGVGPAYEDKAARTGVRAGDILFPDLLRERIAQNLDYANGKLTAMGGQPLVMEQVLEECLEDILKLTPYVRDTTALLNAETRRGQSILLEGAQGTMLDIDYGTYPFVTSSHPTTGGAVTGTGLSLKAISGALGISKAYTTRVGGGPFPTELTDELGAFLQKKGNEFGAVTGRPRRTGWFDAVVVRYATMINGLDAIALTKLDVLDGLDEINICIAYRCRGEVITDMPYSADLLAECEPVYETLPGWKDSTVGLTEFAALPEEAKRYIARLEELCEAPMALISTGPERNETIIREASPVSEWISK